MADIELNQLNSDNSPDSGDLVPFYDSSTGTSDRSTVEGLFQSAPDSSIPATGINFDSGIWWEVIGKTQLSSSGDTISVSSLPARKYLKLYLHIDTSGQNSVIMRFNSDSGSNYEHQASTDNGGFSGASGTSITVAPGAVQDRFIVMDILNIADTIKFGSARITNQAGGTPSRRDLDFTWDNSVDSIDQIAITNGGSGDFGSGSELIVLGSNGIGVVS